MTNRKSRSDIKPARGALWIIAALLMSSGILRIVTGTGPALAREVGAMIDHTPGAAAPMACETSESVTKVLEALNARKKALEKREAALADRTAALNLAEQEIQKNMSALKDAEDELTQTLALADTAATDDLDRLTAVYESMKPKEASALFEEMAPDFAAGFLGRMRPDSAAAIMAGLKAPTAYSISVILAGRNADVPTQ